MTTTQYTPDKYFTPEQLVRQALVDEYILKGLEADLVDVVEFIMEGPFIEVPTVTNTTFSRSYTIPLDNVKFSPEVLEFFYGEVAAQPNEEESAPELKSFEEGDRVRVLAKPFYRIAGAVVEFDQRDQEVVFEGALGTIVNSEPDSDGDWLVIFGDEEVQEDWSIAPESLELVVEEETETEFDLGSLVYKHDDDQILGVYFPHGWDAYENGFKSCPPKFCEADLNPDDFTLPVQARSFEVGDRVIVTEDTAEFFAPMGYIVPRGYTGTVVRLTNTLGCSPQFKIDEHQDKIWGCTTIAVGEGKLSHLVTS